MIKKWNNQQKGFLEALKYIRARQKGLSLSIKSPWDKVNDATVDGFELNSMTVVGGRPGSGKTLFKDQFIKEVFKLNPSLDIRVLEFQFEMVARSSAIRKFSSELGKSYKHLCSASGLKLSNEEFTRCKNFAKEYSKYPVDVVENPMEVVEYSDCIKEYMYENSKLEDVLINNNIVKKRKYKPTIVTLDHSILIKKSKKHTNKLDTLYELGEITTELKRKYPVAFVILSQLNRSVDKPERNENGKYGNYILPSDIFGSDALLQHAETVIGLNRPGKSKIKYFGPNKFIIDDENILVMHFLKCRNGDTRISFFKAEFDKMRIIEIDTPPCVVNS